MVSIENDEQQRISDPDQRYLPRWEVSNRVLYALDDDLGYHEGHTKDLSCSGACLRIGPLREPSPQKIKLTLFLSDDKAVRLDGLIRWMKTDKDDSQVGVSFYNTPAKTQETILDYAFEFKHAQVEKHWFNGWK